MPKLDLAYSKFCHRGSYLKVARRPRQGDLAVQTSSAASATLRNLPADEWAHDLFSLSLNRGSIPLSAEALADPVLLTLRAKDGSAASRITFSDAASLRLETRGADLELRALQAAAWTWLVEPGHAVLAFRGAQLQARLVTASPEDLRIIQADRPALVLKAGSDAQLELGPALSAAPHAIPAFEDVLAARSEEFAAWMRLAPSVCEGFESAAVDAWRLFYHNQVPSAGVWGSRRPLYVTRDYLNATWSWDNCFHALAVAGADPELAFDQLRIFFDRQAHNGQFADRLDDVGANFTHTKPPLFGWTLQRLVTRLGIERCRSFLEEAYEPLSANQRWWTAARQAPVTGLPVWLHGNDSGWDNSTLFDHGTPVCGPDLSAYLLIQSETLGLIADLLGRSFEAGHWRAEAASRKVNLLRHLVLDGRFIALIPGLPPTQPSRSLQTCIPVILGPRLPTTILKNIVHDLRPDGPFLTHYGPASEARDSMNFEADGYWRGSVWAPASSLLAHGLRAAGETRLAAEIARRWCGNCVARPGFWENYSAVDGSGQRAPETLWSAAVFIDFLDAFGSAIQPSRPDLALAAEEQILH